MCISWTLLFRSSIFERIYIIKTLQKIPGFVISTVTLLCNNLKPNKESLREMFFALKLPSEVDELISIYRYIADTWYVLLIRNQEALRTPAMLLSFVVYIRCFHILYKTHPAMDAIDLDIFPNKWHLQFRYFHQAL